jgi:hypothetical protein
MAYAIMMVILAAIYRLVPHPMNVAPVAALALVGGLYFGRRYALWVPVAILAISDLVLNTRMGYPVIYLPRVIDYVVFAVIALLGLWLRDRKTSLKVAGALATPLFFFALSNFGVWLFGLNLANQYYAKTWAGLVECYAAALPFLRGTLVGDWAFMALFAGGALALRRAPSPKLHELAEPAKA